MGFCDIYSVNFRECILVGARQRYEKHDADGNILGESCRYWDVKFLDNGEYEYGLAWSDLTWVRHV